jgi:nicotinamide-nucleotide amidase
MTLEQRAAVLLDKCRSRGFKIATAESCTGGMVAALLTSIAGSSDVFDRGFVTYSNESKKRMLSVSDEVISEFGAVSRECSLAMVHGAIFESAATLAVSITGVAGPGGGSPSKPVGLVHFACARRNGATMHREERCGFSFRSPRRM